jgi:hypothetical protein
LAAVAAPARGADDPGGNGVAISAGVERIDETAGGVPGLNDEHQQFGFVGGELAEKRTFGLWELGLGASGEGGGAPHAGARYGDLTVKPSIKRDFSRSSHHLELTGTGWYDGTGLGGRPLREQLDNAALTPAQRKRYRTFGAASDHYVELGPRTSLIFYDSATILGQGIDTKTFLGGGFVEQLFASGWKLRVGGSALKVFYDRRGVSSAGPEVSTVADLSPAAQLVLKAGVQQLTDDTGRSEGDDGGITYAYERDDLGAKIAAERTINSKPVGPELTTSDTVTLTLRSQLDRQNAVEMSGQQIHEEWLRGPDRGASDDGYQASLRHVFSLGGATWKKNRGSLNVTTEIGTEDLRDVTGGHAHRQTLRFVVERIL